MTEGQIDRQSAREAGMQAAQQEIADGSGSLLRMLDRAIDAAVKNVMAQIQEREAKIAAVADEWRERIGGRVAPSDPVLAGITVDDITDYLGRQGWRQDATFPNPNLLLFRQPGQPGAVMIPAKTEFRDFPQRLADLVKALGEIEGRPAVEVVRSIKRPSGGTAYPRALFLPEHVLKEAGGLLEGIPFNTAPATLDGQAGLVLWGFGLQWDEAYKRMLTCQGQPVLGEVELAGTAHKSVWAVR